MEVDVDHLGTFNKDIEIHKTRDVADLMREVKKWLTLKLPKTLEYEGFFLTHRGSILKETSLLADCGIDKDTQVFVTLEFKPPIEV